MLKPMEPEYYEQIDQSGDCFFQIKWDGIRLIADKNRGKLDLYTRKARIRTSHYPELIKELEGISHSDFLIDGELIALGPDGLPDFQDILKRDLAKKVRRDIPIAYMAFDCLRFEGESLLDREIEERQSYLHRVLQSHQQLRLISDCRNFEDGVALFEQMRARGMEGIVAKRRHSPYLPGRKTALWRKTKCWREITVAAQAVNYREGRPASLVVTRSVKDREPIGSVSTGLSADDWRLILKGQNKASGKPGSVPLSPPIPLSVRFLEWTHEGRLRSPVVLYVNPDLSKKS